MMAFLRFIFVILLCIPVAYVALRLITSLIDKTVYEARHGETAGQHPARDAQSYSSYDDIAARAEARRAEREARPARKKRSRKRR